MVDEIVSSVARHEYVLPAQRRNTQQGEWYDLTDQRCSGQAVWRLVDKVAKRAGLRGNPHALRGAFADLVERHGGVRVAQ